MVPFGPQERVSVCLALSSRAADFSLELAEMLRDTLGALGFRPVVVRDGDPSALSAHVLLLFGNCRRYEGYARLLRGRPDARPITALWQLHPLPPPTLTAQGEKMGLRAASWDGATLQRVRNFRLLRSALPPFLRRGLAQGLRIALFRRLRGEMDVGVGHDPRGADPDSTEFMMLQYAWIKRRWPEGWLDHIFVGSLAREEFLSRRGIPSQFVPLGYHSAMGDLRRGKRDLDVLFIGGLHGRRRATLEKLERSLSARGIKLTTVDRDCFGEKRTQLLNRARISLNVVNYPWDLPGQRFLMSMGCGALVVSEHIDYTAPYVAGEHFVEARVADLADAIVYYLSHAEERERIVRLANDFVTRELTLQNSVAAIMRVCHADSAFSTGGVPGGH